MLGFSPDAQAKDKDKGSTTYEYNFEFVNGTVITGSSPDNVVFVADAGGTDAANPTGMELHISCSDEFPGGWGEKDGPDQDDDSAWQIAAWSIVKVKDGEVDKTCGNVPPPPPPPPPAPSIDIEKSVNGEDADSPTGPEVNVGDTVELGYVVTNTGNLTLTDVQVIDNDLGSILCPKTTLLPDESMVCEEQTVLVESAGQVFMEAEVTGVAEVGAPVAPTPADTEDKSYNYAFVFENGTVITGSSPDNVPFIPNIGGTDADNPTGMVLHVSCSDEFPDGWGEKDGPDRDDDSAWRIASYSIVKWENGEIKNTCGETFSPVTQTVMDDDPIHYLAVDPGDPSVDIEKTVNGEDADEAPGPSFEIGDKITIEYVVTNDGDVDLINVAVVDDTLGPLNCEKTELAVGESMSCDMYMKTAAVAGPVYMEATVTAEDDNGTPVDDTDPINFVVVVPPVTPPSDCEVEVDITRVGGDVTIIWSSVDGAAKYILRENGKAIAKPTGTSYVATDRGPGVYRYAVQSVGVDGTRSGKKYCGKIVIEGTILPPLSCSVELTSASAGDLDVVVTWLGVDDAVKYIVRRSGASIAKPTGTSYVDENVADGVYTYSVQSVSADGTRSEKTTCGKVRVIT